MEFIAGLKDTGIAAVAGPTKLAFMKLLETRRSEIEKHPRQTFQFGATDRHKLDVYYPDPAAISPNGPVPVLFFVYGGGFVFGERQENPPFDLGYGNLGTFFAKRGILTVIPDYRLYPHVTFPGPVEDVRDAIAWFLANTSSVTSAAPSTVPATTPLSSIFVLSHSAGTSHLATLYLSPTLLPLDAPVRAATRGLVTQGSAYFFDLARQDLLPPGVLDGYYASPETAAANMPLALLKAASAELLQALPEIFVMKSEREPPVIFAGSDVFVETLEGRLGKKVRFDVMKSHNHISPHWALMSGEGEEWGEDVVAWVKVYSKLQVHGNFGIFRLDLKCFLSDH